MNTWKQETHDIAEGFRQSIRRPAWVSSATRQAAVVVGDASGSMAGMKSKQATEAISRLSEELARPENKGAFDFGLVTFGASAKRRIDLCPATEARRSLGSATLRGDSGTTNISAGLEEADRIIDEALSRSVEQVAPVVLLFSDGGHNTGRKPDAIAQQIKAKATLVAIAYERGDKDLMRRLASSPQHFYECPDGASLRALMAAVGKTMTQTLARGDDGMKELAEIDGAE